MDLPGEGIPKLGADTEKALSLVPTNLASFKGEAQRRPTCNDGNACAEICVGS